MIPQTETELELLGLDPDGPRVVAVGGGHGLAVSLEAIQAYAGEITAVVTVADDGGSSGRLIEGIDIPPPGDIRKCLLALTPEPSLWSELFAYRFAGADVGGHSLGNLLLAALTDLRGDFTAAVDTAAELLGAVGRVLPAAMQPLRLAAMVGGRRVEGQVSIQHSPGGVERLEVGPPGVAANPAAIEAIRTADQIVLGPGSLFTSVMAALCVPGLAKAVQESPGSRVFVLNLVTQDAETLGMSGREHLEALHRLAGVTGPGAIVAHRGPLAVPSGHDAVTVSTEEAAALGWRVVYADVADPEAEWPAHDPLRLGRVLAGLAGG